MTIWTPQPHAPPLICMQANPCHYSILLLGSTAAQPQGRSYPHVIKKKKKQKRQKMPKSFWKSIESGIGPRGGSYELDRCNYSLFKTLPSTTLSFLVRHLLHLNLNLSLSFSLSLMAIATESPQQEKVIQLGKKMLLSCVIRVLICIRWVGFLCFSDLNSLYPFAWFVKINGFSLFL